MITEGVEPIFIIGAVVASFVIFAVITAILYCVSCCCCRCQSNCEDGPGCECDSKVFASKCLSKCDFFLQQVLSAFFDIIETAEENGNNIVLVAKRRWPKNTCCYVYVLAYFIVLLILVSLLFLSLFSNFFIYRKTSACNDINVKTENSICFDIDDGYKVVDCLERQNDPDLNVICYLSDIGPFRALGIAFGAIQAVRSLISILFPIGLQLGLKWPHFTTAIQVTGLLVSSVPNILLYTKFRTQVLYGDPPLLHLTLWLVLLTVIVFIAGHPWWAFKRSTVFEKKTRRAEDGSVKYLADVETSVSEIRGFASHEEL